MAWANSPEKDKLKLIRVPTFGNLMSSGDRLSPRQLCPCDADSDQTRGQKKFHNKQPEVITQDIQNI